MATGKHYGAFAGGFAKSLTEMMKLYLMQQHYEALNKHYAAQEELWANRGVGKNKGLTPEQIAAGQQAGRDWDKGGSSGGGGGTVGGDGLAIAGKLRDHMMQEYGLTKDQATGFVGTLGYESGNFKTLQEGSPAVKGSRGGYGYAQWTDTGPGSTRRTDFERYAAANHLDPASYEANQGFIDQELKGKFAPALEAIKQTGNVADAAKATLVHYEGMPDTAAIRAQGGIPATQQHIDRALAYDRQLGAPGSASEGTQVGRDTTLSQPSKIMTGNAGGSAAPIDDPKLSGQKPQAVAAVSSALNNAKSMLGKNEVPNHDEVMTYLKDGGQDLDPHKSAWCAAFVSASLKKAGLPVPDVVRPGTETGPGNVAGDYRTWGSAVQPKSIQSGDVLVANDGSHVGFAEGPIRQGPNGPEAKIIAGNETDKSGKYQRGSYTMQSGRVINRSQVGQVGERWVPLNQYSARRAVPGTTADGKTANVSASASDSQKVAAAKQASPGDGSYQTAGTVPIALSPEEAEKSRKDLEAHRAAPDVINDLKNDQDLRVKPVTQDPPLIQFGGVHPENVFQHHPRNSPTLGPVFPGPSSGSNAAPSPGPHGDAPSDVPTPETVYDKTHGPQTVRPEAPIRPAIPPVPGARPEAPMPAPTPAPPPATINPDTDKSGSGATINPDTDKSPEIVGTINPDTDKSPEILGTINPDTDKSPEILGTINPNTDKSVSGATINPDTDKSPLVRGAPRKGGSAANKPSKSAQPVSSSNPPGKSAASAPAIPSNPQGNSSGPGWTTIERPNIDQAGGGRSGGGRQQSQMGVLDLSHLWGPNPPLSQQTSQQAPAPAPAPTPAPAASSPLPSRLPDDMADNASLGMDIMGSAKGGPIGFRQGGAIPTRPTMKFAAAGAVPYTNYQDPATAAPSMGMFNAGAYANPNMQLWNGGEQWLGSQSTSPYSAQAAEMTPGGVQADINALPANLQAWYNQQNANAMTGGGGGSGNAWYYNPASIPAAPAATTPAATTAATSAAPAPVAPTSSTIVSPAASTTINDPTTTTTTGAPGIPNAIQAKSYDPNVDQQTGAGFANTSNTGGTNYSVGSNDLLKTTSDNTISGSDDGTNRTKNQTILSAKGGAIPPRATKFATGGTASAANPAYTAILQGTYNGPTSGGGWMGTPQGQLAPNQQTWATGQQGIWNQIDQATAAKDPTGRLNYMNQLTMMPDAVWPAPAAAAAPAALNEPGPSASTSVSPTASSTINDPTTTTTTGAPGLPNSIQAKSYDPNVDQQTGAGFANTSNAGGTNYSVGADDLLKTNAAGDTISGSDNSNTTILSRKGGPIPRVTPRVRYDDGGGVSGTIAGMPPGLSGGGQQATPPIYYNPATYAAAGAPVGKGVSATSAPTFGAGAIPSLPMARGGVVAFDDGGDVGQDMNEDRQTAQDDQMTTALLDQRDAAAAAPPAPTGAPSDYYSPADYQTPAPATPAPRSGQGGAAPAGAAPWTPEITDGQGNPSKGLIGAIGDGLHWLGEHLGLTGGGPSPAVAPDPQTQTNRSNFARQQNVGGWDQNQQQQAASMIDPNSSLNAAERQIAVMEGTYKFMLSQGDSAGAGKMAASILQYSVQTSQKFAEDAAKQFYNGNLKGAVENFNHASDAVPLGQQTHMVLDPDGKTITVQGKTVDGRTLWQQKGSAEAILQYATNRGKTGQMQWDALESQAAKYDPTFKEMQANRTKNVYAQGKTDADAAAQAQANDAIAKLGPQFGDASGDQSGGQSAPASAPVTPALPGPGAAPATTTANAAPTPAPTPAPSPGKTADTTSAQPASPPATSDENQGQGPTVANADKGAGLPAQPDSADLPTSDAQSVSLEQDKGYQAIVANTTPKYFTSDGRPLVGGRPMNRPPTIDAVTLKSYAPQVQAAYNERWKEYTQAVQENQAAMRSDIDGQRRDYAANLTSQRSAQSQAHSDAQQTARMREQEKLQGQNQAHQDEAAATRAKNEADAKALATKTAEEHAARAPRPDADVHKAFALEPDENGKITGKQPADYYKDQAATMPDGTVNPDPAFRASHYNQEFSDRNQRGIMDTALVNGYRYTHDAEPAGIADALRGFATNSYTATAVRVPEDGYGQRYAVTFTRPSDGSQIAVVLPATDWKNVLGVQQTKEYQKSLKTPAPPMYTRGGYGPPTPSGQSAGTPVSKMFGWQRGGAIPSHPMQLGQ